MHTKLNNPNNIEHNMTTSTLNNFRCSKDMKIQKLPFHQQPDNSFELTNNDDYNKVIHQENLEIDNYKNIASESPLRCWRNEALNQSSPSLKIQVIEYPNIEDNDNVQF